MCENVARTLAAAVILSNPSIRGKSSPTPKRRRAKRDPKGLLHRAMIIDAHAHIMRRVHGRIRAGETRSLPYGRLQVGTETTSRLLPPLSRGPASFPAEVLIEHMDWAG